MSNEPLNLVMDIPSPDTFFKDLYHTTDLSVNVANIPNHGADVSDTITDIPTSFMIDGLMNVQSTGSSAEIAALGEVSSSTENTPSPESYQSSESSQSSLSSSLPISDPLPSGTEQLSGSVSSSASEKPTSSLKYPPCAVCSGKSSGLHYGCYTCEACKNFFRRYLLKNDSFRCKRAGNCEIINQSRGNCAGCRLQKCLAVGMSKEKSKIGRYTHAQRTQTIKEVNKLEGKVVEEVTFLNASDWCEQPCVNGEDVKVEPEEIDQSGFGLIDALIEAMDKIEHFGPEGQTHEGRMKIIEDHYEKYLARVRLFGPLNAIPKEEYFTLLKMHNIDLDGRWDQFKRDANNCQHIVQRYCEFSFRIPGFKELTSADQGNLLKFGHCEFFIILMHEGYVDEYKIFLEMNGVPSHLEEAADKIFSRTMIELQCDLFMRWQKLKLTKAEVALLIAMSVVCSDRCDLEQPEKVSEIHTMLTNILLNYLKLHYGSAAQKRFSKFIDCITNCRSGSEMYFKEYKELSQNQMITDAAPAFPTLCPDV